MDDKDKQLEARKREILRLTKELEEARRDLRETKGREAYLKDGAKSYQAEIEDLEGAIQEARKLLDAHPGQGLVDAIKAAREERDAMVKNMIDSHGADLADIREALRAEGKQSALSAAQVALEYPKGIQLLFQTADQVVWKDLDQAKERASLLHEADAVVKALEGLFQQDAETLRIKVLAALEEARR